MPASLQFKKIQKKKTKTEFRNRTYSEFLNYRSSKNKTSLKHKRIKQ